MTNLGSSDSKSSSLSLVERLPDDILRYVLEIGISEELCRDDMKTSAFIGVKLSRTSSHLRALAFSMPKLWMILDNLIMSPDAVQFFILHSRQTELSIKFWGRAQLPPRPRFKGTHPDKFIALIGRHAARWQALKVKVTNYEELIMFQNVPTREFPMLQEITYNHQMSGIHSFDPQYVQRREFDPFTGWRMPALITFVASDFLPDSSAAAASTISLTCAGHSVPNLTVNDFIDFSSQLKVFTCLKRLFITLTMSAYQIKEPSSAYSPVTLPNLKELSFVNHFPTAHLWGLFDTLNTPNLRHLTLGKVTAAVFPSTDVLIQRCVRGQLRSLKIIGRPLDQDLDIEITHILERLPNLKNMAFYYTSITHDQKTKPRLLPPLQRLTLIGCNYTKPRLVYDLLDTLRANEVVWEAFRELRLDQEEIHGWRIDPEDLKRCSEDRLVFIQ